jgi:hypothetical protein
MCTQRMRLAYVAFEVTAHASSSAKVATTNIQAHEGPCGEGRLTFCDFTATLLRLYYNFTTTLRLLCQGDLTSATLLRIYCNFTTTLILLCQADFSSATLLILCCFFQKKMLYYQRTRVHAEKSVEQWNNFVAITARPLILFFVCIFFFHYHITARPLILFCVCIFFFCQAVVVKMRRRASSSGTSLSLLQHARTCT